jgi:O-succinylbenzoic acid--CoA ligase
MERAELKAVLRGTNCAVERGEIVFLCDPNWTANERDEAERQMANAGATKESTDDGWLGVRTGGSGGVVKFARHDERTLSAAVRGFCEHFKITRVNAIDVLPAHHVSGLMARVRCAMTGGQHCAWGWKHLEAGTLPGIAGDEWVISLVPTQLQRLLRSEATVAWLRRLALIFVGGGPVWAELADEAAAAQLRVSLSYGMTETAAMIAALQPAEFLTGIRSSGTILPHAQVTIDPADEVIRVASESLFRGYWPTRRDHWDFATGDFGKIDERGHLHVLGRRDGMIITGGKKVNAQEVEAALRACGEFTDIAVLGVADREWGEAIVACYPVDGSRAPDFARAVEQLPGYQRPKQFVAIAAWPRDAQGKLNRAALRAAIEKHREDNA